MPPSAQSPSRLRLPIHIVPFVILSWLIPGLGFFLLGRRSHKRAALYTVIVHVTFFVGILLHGGVVPPVPEPGVPTMAIIGMLVFIMQLGAGWPAVLSLLAWKFGWTGLAAQPVSYWYELGSFYCLVAGTLNYFIACQSFDATRKPAFENLTE